MPPDSWNMVPLYQGGCHWPWLIIGSIFVFQADVDDRYEKKQWRDLLGTQDKITSWVIAHGSQKCNCAVSSAMPGCDHFHMSFQRVVKQNYDLQLLLCGTLHVSNSQGRCINCSSSWGKKMTQDFKYKSFIFKGRKEALMKYTQPTVASLAHVAKVPVS